MQRHEHGNQGPEQDPGAINAGNYIVGGTFNGPVGGSQSGSVRQVQYAGGDHDLPQRIEPLLRRLEAIAEMLGGEEAEAVADDVGTLRAELCRPEPSPKRLRAGLIRITRMASAAPGMLETVSEVKDVLTPLLS